LEVSNWARAKLWELTQFSKILFMDAYSMPIDNIDHIFMSADPEPSTPLAAYSQPECHYGDSCQPRTTGSHRFFMLAPLEQVAHNIFAELDEGKSHDPNFWNVVETVKFEFLEYDW
jgi:hypothetical protein